MSALTRFWMRLLPDGFLYADRLTVSAVRFFLRAGVGLIGLALGAAGASLIDSTNWREVGAGALLAWSVAVLAWAVTSYRHGQREALEALQHTAEIDVLHLRLNEIAAKVGGSQLDIDTELGHMISARVERLAHFSGLDEFR